MRLFLYYNKDQSETRCITNLLDTLLNHVTSDGYLKDSVIRTKNILHLDHKYEDSNVSIKLIKFIGTLDENIKQIYVLKDYDVCFSSKKNMITYILLHSTNFECNCLKTNNFLNNMIDKTHNFDWLNQKLKTNYTSISVEQISTIFTKKQLITILKTIKYDIYHYIEYVASYRFVYIDNICKKRGREEYYVD